MARALLIGCALTYYVFGIAHRTYDPFDAAVFDRVRFLLPVRVFLEAWGGPALPVQLFRAGWGEASVWIGWSLGLAPVLIGIAARRMSRDQCIRLLVLGGTLLTFLWVSATTRPLAARADLWGGRYYYAPQYLYLLITACLMWSALRPHQAWNRTRVGVALGIHLIAAAVVLRVNRHAWWEQVPKDGTSVARVLERLSAAERGRTPDERIVHRRGKWTLTFQVRRPK